MPCLITYNSTATNSHTQRSKWKIRGEGTPFSAWAPSREGRAHQMLTRVNFWRHHLPFFFSIRTCVLLMIRYSKHIQCHRRPSSSNTTKFTMKCNAGSLIYISWSGERCTAGRGHAHYCSRAKPLHSTRSQQRWSWRSPSLHLISSSALGVGGYCILMANRCLCSLQYRPHMPPRGGAAVVATDSSEQSREITAMAERENQIAV